MKTKPLFLFLVFTLLLVTSVVTSQSSSIIQAKSGPAAFGQGEFTFQNELISFSFRGPREPEESCAGTGSF